ncbi:hypothetical protein L841_5135 [Mycobacterium sp. MAC_080597_8934]|nr:hypothetical protein L841_5135 [Mycobacterium sp. MAC_080597_8934]
MRGQGHQIFVDELARFAAAEADPRVTAIAQRAAAPLRVVVRGRRGVGRRTLARALDRAGRATGIAVTTDAADVVVHVTAEVIKPEDTQAISTARAAGHPVLAVLSKADLVGSLSGRGGDGPIAAARARCADLSALIGVPIRPAIGLLAVAALDDLGDDLWAALRTLAADPAACLDGSIAGFLGAGVDVPAAARERLLDTLDLFGTALAIAAIRRGAGRHSCAPCCAGSAASTRCWPRSARWAPRCATGGCWAPSRNWRRWPSARSRSASGSAASCPGTTPWSPEWRRLSTWPSTWPGTWPGRRPRAIRPVIWHEPCAGSATAGRRAATCTARAAPTSPGDRCGCGRRPAPRCPANGPSNCPSNGRTRRERRQSGRRG